MGVRTSVRVTVVAHFTSRSVQPAKDNRQQNQEKLQPVVAFLRNGEDPLLLKAPPISAYRKRPSTEFGPRFRATAETPCSTEISLHLYVRFQTSCGGTYGLFVQIAGVRVDQVVRVIGVKRKRVIMLLQAC